MDAASGFEQNQEQVQQVAVRLAGYIARARRSCSLFHCHGAYLSRARFLGLVLFSA